MKALKLLVWSLIVLAIGLLFFSLRYSENQMELAIAAFAIWGIATLVDRYLKKKSR